HDGRMNQMDFLGGVNRRSGELPSDSRDGGAEPAAWPERRSLIALRIVPGDCVKQKGLRKWLLLKHLRRRLLIQRRARDSNPQPVSRHHISSVAANQFAYPPGSRASPLKGDAAGGREVRPPNTTARSPNVTTSPVAIPLPRPGQKRGPRPHRP